LEGLDVEKETPLPKIKFREFRKFMDLTPFPRNCLAENPVFRSTLLPGYRRDRSFSVGYRDESEWMD